MNENNLEYTQMKRNPNAIEGGGAEHKGKELGKLEQCIYVICLLIIACIEMWRMNWKEMEILYLNCNEKVVYALKLRTLRLRKNYRIFVLCWIMVWWRNVKENEYVSLREF